MSVRRRTTCRIFFLQELQQHERVCYLFEMAAFFCCVQWSVSFKAKQLEAVCRQEETGSLKVALPNCILSSGKMESSKVFH